MAELPLIEKAAESAESGVMQLVPLKIPETEFLKFFDDYLTKIDHSQKSTFGDAETCYKQMKNGYEQHYLKFTKGKEVEGLLCVNIDHNQQSEFRGYIRHLSVVDRTKYSEALQIALDFIW
jgi:hypothetical protein